MLEDFCYRNDKSLEYISLSPLLKKLGNCCFINTNLREIEIPEGVLKLANIASKTVQH